MLKISIATWIANAAACLTGLYGDVTHQADAADCSRQTVYDHAQKVRAAVEAEHSGGPTRAELIQENSDLRQENAAPLGMAGSDRRVSPGQATRVHCHGHGHGPEPQSDPRPAGAIMGVQARPGRTTLHRWIKAAGIAAGRVLKHLDARCQALVLVGCLDEIFFHRRPVLVGVEPTSMVWFLGQKANDRTGSTWSRALQDFPAALVRPGGCGNGPASRDRCGATATATGRETAVGERPRCVPHHPGGAARSSPDLEPRGTALGAGRSGRSPGRAGAATGPRCAGAAVAVRCTWKKTATAFQQYERSEAGWKIAHAALQVFRPEGRLNERPWAQEQIARRCPSCRGASGPRSGTTSRRRRR